ncbi:phage baseplate assembly protein V [Actinophytocola glycyrrhizae]|uniref:Phage baseplate assembly protein V n=1 Tax=Actinophytocola glycyrrhizae TaxID=2044873 RepID=A0ABV9S294_9PSEU
MTDTEESVANVEATGRPTVAVDGTPLRADLAVRLQRVVVDNDAHLPGMFELTFLDVDGRTLREARISMGSAVTITGAGPAGAALTLLTGEVTGLEAQIRGMTQRTIVRGYTAEHRLQRARRSRSFVNVTDADVARRIATEAGLTVRDVRCSGFTHGYLAQVNQTDWEFLDARARETGCEFGVVAGEFHFHPSGAGRAAQEVAIRYPDDLISFRPRITAGNLTPDVEVRVWDPLARKAVAENVSMVSGGEHSPRSLGQRFTSTGRPGGLGALGRVGSALAAGDLGGVASGLGGLGSAGAGGTGAAGSALGGMLGSPVGYLGPQPSATANIRSDRPFARASAMPTAGPTVAGAFGTAAGSTFAEAEGEVKGNAAVQPGAVLRISGVQAEFGGTWRVSRARHVFDDVEFGYRVIFSAHGRQDRTMVGLASRATAPGADRARMSGVVCGVVSDCADPLAKGRMKLTLPWLSPDFETDWAPNIQFVAGQKTGAMFLPEVGDEVLVAFEFGDIRRPYVLGGMMNNLTQWDVSASGPLQAGGEFVGGIVDSILNEDANIFTNLADTFKAQMTMGTGLAKKVVGNVTGTAGFATGGLVDTSAAGDTYGELADANLAMYTDAADSVADGLSGISGGGGSAAGSVVAPGMVSEVHHRGFVSSTGNSLLFYDVPLPMGGAAGGGLGAGGTGGQEGSGGTSTASTSDAGGTTGGGVAGAGLGTPAIGSSVRLGSQNGEVSVTVDQVNAGVSINAAMVPGTSVNPMPSISLSAENGLVYLSAGTAGAAMINGGAGMAISATGTITLAAENVNVVGLLTVNGVPVPI